MIITKKIVRCLNGILTRFSSSNIKFGVASADYTVNMYGKKNDGNMELTVVLPLDIRFRLNCNYSDFSLFFNYLSHVCKLSYEDISHNAKFHRTRISVKQMKLDENDINFLKVMSCMTANSLEELQLKLQIMGY